LYQLKITEKKEINNNRRLEYQLKMNIELTEKEFNNKIILDNREFVPKATKEILICVNSLFYCTEKLVCNYPGGPYTGTNPDLIFVESINNISDGFPKSFYELVNLDKHWRNAYRGLENITFHNSMFFPDDTLKHIECILAKSHNIKTYFYAQYGGIENDEQLNLRRKEYKKRKKGLFFDDSIMKSASNVLNEFNDLRETKSSLSKSINSYTKNSTNFKN